MDINIILGISLIILIIYFVSLMLSLWRLNRQVEKATQWNNFRELLFNQAQKDQVEAHRISLAVQSKYKDLGAPYAKDRDQTVAILGRISENAQTVLKDQNQRMPINPNTKPYSLKTLFIVPIWAEYRDRQDWWNTTEKLGSRLSRNLSGFSAVEKLERRLSRKGEGTKVEFETLKKKTDDLINAFQSEARTSSHFQDQIQQLQQLGQKIDHTVTAYLKDTALLPKQIATAAAQLKPYQQEWEQLNQILKESKGIRLDTRSQLAKNQAKIKDIEELLNTEENANHPVQHFREALKAEITALQEQEQKREAGIYLKQPAHEQYARLHEIEKNLHVLIQERLMLEERLKHGEREIALTEAWIKTFETPFFIDRTDIVLEEVKKQQSMLGQLIKSSEDIDLLSSQIFIDPQKLASNRTNFDQRVQTYKSLYKELKQKIPPFSEEMRVAIQNLRPLNLRYQKDLDLDVQTTKTQSLEERWLVFKDPNQIKESQIDQRIADLEQLEKSLYEIQSACQIAEEQYKTSSIDRVDAQQIVEDQAFTELHQVMQVISRENQISLSSQADEFASQAEQLNSALEKIDTDFAAATKDAASLLTNMKALWENYKQIYTGEQNEYQAITAKLTTLNSNFEKYQEHELFVLRTRANEPINKITTWLQILPSQSIQALQIHVDQGYQLYEEVGKIAKELKEEDRSYTRAKEEAIFAIEEAKAAIGDAEKELTKIPWGVQESIRNSQTSQARSPELEHSYRYLDFAETTFKEITNPEIEYHSVELVIRELRQQVCQSANHATEEAKRTRREIREQINDINQKCENLKKTLAQGEGHSMRLEDTGFRSQWQQISRKYRDYESELKMQVSYREAFSYLEQALIESRYQIARMREFEDSA